MRFARPELRGFKRCDLTFDEFTDIRIDPTPARGVGACRFSLITADAVISLSLHYEPGPEPYRRMRDEIIDVVFSGRHRPDEQRRDLP